MIGGSVVHSFGMQETLRVVGIDRHGRVVSCLLLEPHRLARLRGTAWVLELPAGEPYPVPGSALRVSAST
jgi:uncharacterized membrane protein (UPF0127 family)